MTGELLGEAFFRFGIGRIAVNALHFDWIRLQIEEFPLVHVFLVEVNQLVTFGLDAETNDMAPKNTDEKIKTERMGKILLLEGDLSSLN